MLIIYFLMFLAGVLAGEIIAPIYNVTILEQYKLTFIENYTLNMLFAKYYLENLSIHMSLKIVYLYSKIQIFWNKTIRYSSPKINVISKEINNYLLKFKIIKEKILTNETNIEIYKNGNKIKSFLLNKEIQTLDIKSVNDIIKNNLDVVIDYDLITIIPINEKILQNIICYNKIPENFNYEESSIKFLSLQLKYLDKSIEIQLKTDKYNFYMVGNILNQSFFRYFIENIIQTKIPIPICHNFEYKISLLDQNVNMIELNESDIIIILKDNYKIINNKEELTAHFDTEDYIKLDSETKIN